MKPNATPPNTGANDGTERNGSDRHGSGRDGPPYPESPPHAESPPHPEPQTDGFTSSGYRAPADDNELGTATPLVNYTRTELYAEETTGVLAGHVEAMLRELGEDPEREGLVKTPERVAKAMQFLTQGYEMDPYAILSSAVFEEDYSEMILVKDIEVYSLCEHHMLPFFGKAHVAYIPNGRIVGLSKIPRVVDVFARRLQVQERLTLQVRDAIQEVLRPLGVAVIIEAQHMCMIMRGVQKQHSITTTSAVGGEFLNPITREEFMRLIR